MGATRHSTVNTNNMPTRKTQTRKHRGGRGLAGGQHHLRTNMDKYHPGYFGKVGMRYFHKQQNHFWKPVINLDKLWSLVPAEQREKYLAKGRIPSVPLIVRARYFSKDAERKIKEAGGVVQLTASAGHPPPRQHDDGIPKLDKFHLN